MAQTLHARWGDSWASSGRLKPERMTQPPPRSTAGAVRGHKPRSSRGRWQAAETSPSHVSGPRPPVRAGPSGVPGRSCPRRGDALGRQRSSPRSVTDLAPTRLPDKQRHEAVDTFLPAPIQSCGAGGAARKSHAPFNRFLPGMSLQPGRVGQEGLRHEPECGLPERTVTARSEPAAKSSPGFCPGAA